MKTDKKSLTSKDDETPFDHYSLKIINKLPETYKTYKWYIFKGFHYIGRGMVGIFLLSMGAGGYMRIQGHRVQYLESPWFLAFITLILVVGGTIEFFSSKILENEIINYRGLIKRLFYYLKNKKHDDLSIAKIISKIRFSYQAGKGYYMSRLLLFSLLAENSSINRNNKAMQKNANKVIRHSKILLRKYKLRIPLLYYLLGRAYLLKNDRNNALICYNAYLSLKPKDIETANLASSLNQNMGSQ